MKKRWYLAASAVGAVATLVAFYGARVPEDAFAAKYHLIREGTTYEEAVALLGPADHEDYWSGWHHPHISYWKSPDSTEAIHMHWDFRTGELSAKWLLGAKDGAVREVYDWPKPWWERVLTSVGLR